MTTKKQTTKNPVRPCPTQRVRRPTFLSAAPSFDPGIESVLAGHRRRRQLAQDAAERIAVGELYAFFDNGPLIQKAIESAKADLAIHGIGFSDVPQMLNGAAAALVGMWNRD
jgi:hypothetical protein